MERGRQTPSLFGQGRLVACFTLVDKWCIKIYLKIYLESRKVDLYICRMITTKSLRVREDVHRELKIFAANRGVSIIDFASNAILMQLAESGWRNFKPTKKSKSSTNNKTK